jgi:CheY-like chemotaxis protein
MTNILHIVLADDDLDDCLFFSEAMKMSGLIHDLKVVHDGEQLMLYLEHGTEILPDALFLDLNMPRKNGFECLTEIKQSKKLKALPVIIFSTSLEQLVVNTLYDNGALFFIRKPADVVQFNQIIIYILNKIVSKSFKLPLRENFVINIS